MTNEGKKGSALPRKEKGKDLVCIKTKRAGGNLLEWKKGKGDTELKGERQKVLIGLLSEAGKTIDSGPKQGYGQ